MKVSNTHLRELIATRCPSDSDLDAFCIDHFTDVYRRFTSSMDRVAKVNTLIVHADAGRLGERLAICPCPSVSAAKQDPITEQLVEGLMSVLESRGYIKKATNYVHERIAPIADASIAKSQVC